MSIDDDLEMIKFCPHMDWQTNRCSACRAYRLKVALEQAWAERDYERSLRLGKGGAMDAFHREYERAERAEAELFSVKAYAAELIDTLARVRTLCDGPNDCKSCSAYSNIRAATEGDNQ